MKTFTFVGSEMSSKKCTVKLVFPFWVFLVLSSSASGSCRSNGLFPHLSDCRKFFSCTPWGPVLMHCPAGLHFNPQLLICDWPNRAECTDKEKSSKCGQCVEFELKPFSSPEMPDLWPCYRLRPVLHLRSPGPFVVPVPFWFDVQFHDFRL